MRPPVRFVERRVVGAVRPRSDDEALPTHVGGWLTRMGNGVASAGTRDTEVTPR
jgi:hypothetical protein